MSSLEHLIPFCVNVVRPRMQEIVADIDQAYNSLEIKRKSNSVRGVPFDAVGMFDVVIANADYNELAYTVLYFFASDDELRSTYIPDVLWDPLKKEMTTDEQFDAYAPVNDIEQFIERAVIVLSCVDFINDVVDV